MCHPGVRRSRSSRAGPRRDRSQRLLPPGQRLHRGLCAEHHDGRRRFLLRWRPGQGHVHSTLHERPQPVPLDVQRHGVQPRVRRFRVVLHPRHGTAHPRQESRRSHHAGAVRDAGPTRRPGTPPRQNPAPVDAADESGSAPRRLRGHWTPSVGHRRAETTRAFHPGDRENHRRGHPERGEAVPGLAAGTGRTRRNQGHSRRQGHPDGAGRRRGATARQPAALAVPMSSCSAVRLRKIINL
uniref:(northern house mosquito) hypothetical protein n=1 Tax=Culex pipiens TaxID=7175 RepID=A0A8D8AI05_CULPI